MGLYYLQSRYYDPELCRFLNADAFVSTGQGELGNNMFAYCNNNSVCCADVSGQLCYYTCLGDNDLFCDMLTMGGGGGADATRSVLAGKILRDTVSTIDKKTSSAIVLMMSANYGGQLVGESGNLAYDSSGNVAWQTTQSVGSSTSVVWGASFGVGRTISTADDIRNFEGAATGIGLTLCLPEGFSVDIMWFESTTDPGKMEYALTIAYVWGAELEGHLLEAYTETKHLLNLWSIFD